MNAIFDQGARLAADVSYTETGDATANWFKQKGRGEINMGKKCDYNIRHNNAEWNFLQHHAEPDGNMRMARPAGGGDGRGHGPGPDPLPQGVPAAAGGQDRGRRRPRSARGAAGGGGGGAPGAAAAAAGGAGPGERPGRDHGGARPQPVPGAAAGPGREGGQADRGRPPRPPRAPPLPAGPAHALAQPLPPPAAQRGAARPAAGRAGAGGAGGAQAVLGAGLRPPGRVLLRRGGPAGQEQLLPPGEDQGGGPLRAQPRRAVDARPHGHVPRGVLGAHGLPHRRRRAPPGCAPNTSHERPRVDRGSRSPPTEAAERRGGRPRLRPGPGARRRPPRRRRRRPLLLPGARGRHRPAAPRALLLAAAAAAAPPRVRAGARPAFGPRGRGGPAVRVLLRILPLQQQQQSSDTHAAARTSAATSRSGCNPATQLTKSPVQVIHRAQKKTLFCSVFCLTREV